MANIAKVMISLYTREDVRRIQVFLDGAPITREFDFAEDERSARAYAREVFHQQDRETVLVEYNGDTGEEKELDKRASFVSRMQEIGAGLRHVG